MLLSIPDSAKVVAFKPEHPGLWSIKVGGLGFLGLGEAWSPGKLRVGVWAVMWAYR